MITREILNPLSRLILEGAVISGDTVRVLTRAEGEIEQKNRASNKQPTSLGWISSNQSSNDKNDIIIMRNHNIKDPNTQKDPIHGEEYFLEDGTRTGSDI